MRRVLNFGRNLAFQPTHRYVAQDESDVLRILARHRSERVRAIGSLHSWSDAPVAEQVLIDLRRLNTVTVLHERRQAIVGGGCAISRLLRELRREGGYTLPTLGLITAQSIAGAISTATHGSGGHSLSHYVQALRIATYDASTGEPIIRVIDSGAELKAARCCLGTLGIVTAITIQVRREYRVEEWAGRIERIEEFLDWGEEYPLQQCYLLPWRWDYLTQRRREVERRITLANRIHRIAQVAAVDLTLHVWITAIVRLLPDRFAQAFYRRLLLPRSWRVVGRSDRLLTMKHDLIRHIEIELFVKESELAAMVEFAIWLLREFGGEPTVVPESIRGTAAVESCREALRELRGSYVHHFPITIRKVCPDATLISMSTGDGAAWYSLSFISYAAPGRRDGFLRFARVLAEASSQLFGARPHWGKVCPLGREELRRIYPDYEMFCELRNGIDPAGRFLNSWTEMLFGKRDTASPEKDGKHAGNRDSRETGSGHL